MDQTQQKEEVDDKGVPWTNRLKEMERKFEEKYGAELEKTRKELNDLKSRQVVEEPEADNPEVVAKNDLMEFVKNPRGFIQNAYSQAEFQREIPQAESWIKTQKGYRKDDDARIFEIIKENRLDTPYHTPMQRAKTAWRLLEAERASERSSTQDDDARREAAAKRAELEGTGKATSKEQTVTRNDLIRKLAAAEAKGDLDTAIKLTSMLEDVR